jgi:hypothetical protein
MGGMRDDEASSLPPAPVGRERVSAVAAWGRVSSVRERAAGDDAGFFRAAVAGLRERRE